MLGVPGKRSAPHTGGADTHPSPNMPSLTNYTWQPQHLSLLPLLPQFPAASPTAPPNAAEYLLLWPSLRGRLASPPAGAKVFSTRRRKDAGLASQAPPRPTCKAGGGSVCSPADRLNHGEEEEAGRKYGAALPTSGRKHPERKASRISQPSTRRRRRSGDIKQEDGAKDHRIHERPRHQRRSVQAIVQGTTVER